MISVIVPVYNGEGSVGKCLDALLNQDYMGEKEIIVVDNGSTDRTVDIVRGFDVKLISQGRRGPAAARNMGVGKASGEIVLFTDADCIPAMDWVSRMVEPFADLGIWGVQGAYQTEQKELMARFSQVEIAERYERMKRFGDVDFIGTYSAGYRKEVFSRLGGFDESFPLASGEDTEFSYRLSKEGYKLVFNPQALVSHMHPSSLSEYLRVKFWRAYWRVLLYKKHKSKMVRDSYTTQGLKLQIGLFGILFISLVVSVFFEAAFLFAVAMYVLIVAATLPFSFWAFKRDKLAGLASPAVLQLRSLVFIMGLIEGFIRRGS
ncbi:MAG: glycosyltransferase [Candidatus Aenigmarchaeota archaeon]|nr:glycosyltransferase [Candidatus Aenigmarchaeota archaeon]